MSEETVVQILNLLHTMQEACQELYRSAEDGDTGRFHSFRQDIDAGLHSIIRASMEADTAGCQNLCQCCRSVLVSLQRVKALFSADRRKCLNKIEFELLPFLQETYKNFYFYEYLTMHPEKKSDYYQEDIKTLCANSYMDDAERTGTYKYDLSITVLAYNKLEYTKLCVENLLKNIPEGLRYELILVNHGSTDGTKEYFEHIMSEKQLDIPINGIGLNAAVSRIIEGEFTLGVSNDVVITKNVIQNLLTCIRSDPKIGWVVPAAPNIANIQTIPAQYADFEELAQFAQANNISDPFRWEQRTRLCNPIELDRSSVFWGRNGILPFGHMETGNVRGFNDDQISLLLRRRGYKSILAKDAYCHHFGSVTIKNELEKKADTDFYARGRAIFQARFGIDPWGVGFCFDPVFADRIVGEDTGHVGILGINCGMGSNSLKVKEQLKEYCHNTDTTLCNITDAAVYVQDLRGVSDEAELISSIKALKCFLHGHLFHYIIWETPFLTQYKYKTLLDCCFNCLDHTGTMLIKLNDQCRKVLMRDIPNRKELGSGWVMIRR